MLPTGLHLTIDLWFDRLGQFAVAHKFATKRTHPLYHIIGLSWTCLPWVPSLLDLSVCQECPSKMWVMSQVYTMEEFLQVHPAQNLNPFANYMMSMQDAVTEQKPSKMLCSRVLPSRGHLILVYYKCKGMVWWCSRCLRPDKKFIIM